MERRLLAVIGGAMFCVAAATAPAGAIGPPGEKDAQGCDNNGGSSSPIVDDYCEEND